MRRRIRYAGLVVYPWAFGVLLGGSAATPALAGDVHPSRWVSSDAAVYLEVLEPGKVVDRVLGDSVQKALGAVPQYAKALRSDEFAEAKRRLDELAGKLDTTWDRGLLRDLTSGGVILAAEGDPGAEGRVVIIVTPKDPDLLKR